LWKRVFTPGRHCINCIMQRDYVLPTEPESWWLISRRVGSLLKKKMADTEQPQGVLSTVKINTPEIAQLASQGLFIVVCDKIQDPGNLGTIIRTADAAGVHAVFTTPGTVDIYNPKVLRSTMGSVFHLPIFSDWHAPDILKNFQRLGVTPIGTALHAQKWYFSQNYNRSVAIWLGSEASGIDADVLANIPEQVKIPMPGKAESLNVAIAASVVMYEVVRQRMAD
jgi:TrmH family RNA methyltransferase